MPPPKVTLLCLSAEIGILGCSSLNKSFSTESCCASVWSWKYLSLSSLTSTGHLINSKPPTPITPLYLPSSYFGKYKGVIGVGGLLLMRCPIEVKEDRDEYFRSQTQGQSESVENDLFKDEHPSMPITADRQSKVTFGGGKK